MVGKKSTAVVSTVPYYNFLTSIGVILHKNIPTAERENFMIRLTTKRWRNTLCKEEKKPRYFGTKVMFLFLTGVGITVFLFLQQVTEMRII